MRSGVSTMIVSIGTWRRSCSSRSPCGGWSPWKPQMPRRHVAPLARVSRSRRTSATVQRASAMARLLGGVDHQLLPHGQTLLIGRRERGRRRQQLPVSLAHADPLEREQGLAKQRTQVRQHRGDLFAGADGDDHHRHLGVAPEEAGPLAHSVGSAVDAEQARSRRQRPGDGAGHTPRQTPARRPPAPDARRRWSAWWPREAPRAASPRAMSPVSILARSSVIRPWRLTE